MASIFVQEPGKETKYYPLGRRTNVIGRDEGLLIQILDNHVSRKHLQLLYNKDEDYFVANDMDSKHGTFLNGAKLRNETRLRDGDNLTIGQTNIFFSNEDFPDKDNALKYYKKVGERYRNTLTD